MSTEPKLLTEAEAHWLANSAKPSEAQAFLRERGLIAPEPVDPLMVEVEPLVNEWAALDGVEPEDLALAALRRGMELAPAKQLTREDVREAVRQVYRSGGSLTWHIDALHAALVEQMQKI